MRRLHRNETELWGKRDEGQEGEGEKGKERTGRGRGREGPGGGERQRRGEAEESRGKGAVSTGQDTPGDTGEWTREHVEGGRREERERKSTERK